MGISGKTETDMRDYYKKTAVYLQQPPTPHAIRFGNKEEKLAKIGNVGLAKRSWMWGLKHTSRPPIPGVTELFTIYGGSQSESGWMSGKDGIVNGYILENRLAYINEAMPAGWEQMVEQSAINRVMGMARKRMESQ
jgi:hypothetical protein